MSRLGSSRPWRTLRGRLALGYLAGLVAASLVFAITSASLIRNQTEGAQRQELDRQSRQLAAFLSDQARESIVAGKPYHPTARSIRHLLGITAPGTHLYYVGLPLDTGAAGGSFNAIPRLAPDKIEQISFPDLERNGIQQFAFTSPSQRKIRTLASAAPLVLGNQVVGAVVLARDRREFASVWSEVTVRVVLATAIGLVVALALVAWLTRRVTQPLRKMSAATTRVAEGDMRVTFDRGGPEELDRLAQAFNAMVRELAHRDAQSRDFLMKVTHDLRTPLTAIRGHAAALSDGVVPSEDVPRSVGAIQSEAARLEALVADLLDLARLEARRFALELDEVDLQDLLDQAFDAFGAEAAQRGVAFERRVPPLPRLVTDAARVRRIVGNLLDNALRWTPPGGSVRLEARAGPRGGVVAVVADTGPGIPADELEAIFEPFRSLATPDGRQGTGLGLAIARQLARALGGDLTVESREGAGSRFSLELPARASQPTPALVA